MLPGVGMMDKCKYVYIYISHKTNKHFTGVFSCVNQLDKFRLPRVGMMDISMVGKPNQHLTVQRKPTPLGSPRGDRNLARKITNTDAPKRISKTTHETT